jgi:hypothetical protein
MGGGSRRRARDSRAAQGQKEDERGCVRTAQSAQADWKHNSATESKAGREGRVGWRKKREAESARFARRAQEEGIEEGGSAITRERGKQ